MPGDGYEAWYEAIVADRGDWSRREWARYEEALRPWASALFDAEGPVTEAVFVERLLATSVEVARANAALVAEDVAAATGRRPVVEVCIDEDDEVPFTVDRTWESPQPDPWPNPQALADLAAYVREIVMEEQYTAPWPRCPAHGSTAYAEVRGGRATWWCFEGRHAVAEVGRLPSPG